MLGLGTKQKVMDVKGEMSSNINAIEDFDTTLSLLNKTKLTTKAELIYII